MKKIVVIGPESTGKSTLSAALAAALNTAWVPEYARGYLTGLNRDYNEEDLLNIARGQISAEDEACNTISNSLVVCDTDLYVLKVWSEARYGHCNREILEMIATRQYDLYLLTYIDIAWEDDPLREHSADEERHYFYNHYHDIVINSGVAWADIRGTQQQRLKSALQAVAALT